ncbi:hypothetical protein [Solitalea lacus]|uniref:hypothetical protein n=1 Tax=Solitalea lacus TaxID=2911172 RepID=UPI001ED9DA5F|nr:hypothetical protein [Solitalea lacus]UKJ07659.1 hypothetical protein L2B55_00495 [Solitalea lacus]
MDFRTDILLPQVKRLSQKIYLPCLLLVLALVSCRSQRVDWEKVISWPELKANDEFEFVEQKELQNMNLKEISGVAAGSTNPNFIYAIEDSFNANRVYILGSQGQYLGDLKLKNYKNYDWEDIAIGPGPELGKSYIYVADIGDNYRVMNAVIIYRFKEPDLTKVKMPIDTVIRKIDRLRFQYPDKRYNAETILLDPLTKDLYIITKGTTARIYKAPYSKLKGGTMRLQYVGSIPIEQATGGSISADGSQILIKDYKQVYYWKRNEATPIEETLIGPPTLVSYRKEIQGESIGWTNNGKGYFTISEREKREREKPMLNFYRRN